MRRTSDVATGTHCPAVVGVDGSESALRAVDWAADEAVEPREAVVARGFVETSSVSVTPPRPRLHRAACPVAVIPELS
ncbi:hypothetical protein [Streptomyces griseoluteus]|uniref:hypothetical protein n=1 Tax=Streptomyces griseoluteus TaxID=29306 RepID=UPI00142EE772|nr:hypothetical protein [Streptomyces griseoluteus]GHE99282.1 hypothetical protein GCM10017776_15170 [Streptomyces griseoluteus]